ncbi:sensor of ECF-type sigma factor [Flavobacterium sp.]|uniref:sensor of ECF-type sigma factor n=1 Tax=Flavobacterium sp. TaxID=239 RepID=UPI002636B186|nr:sensor of ECF-type sigma factor [Flavobacterium sp.]
MKTIQNPFRVLVLSLLFLGIGNAFAQPGGRLRERIEEKKEQVKSQKVAFITQELRLTPDEAAKFWPIYNAFEDKQAEIRRQKLKAFMDRKEENQLDKMTEKEAQTVLAQMETNEEELFKLRKKLIADLRGVLPALKIIKLRRAEEDFNRKLVEKLKERRRN